MDMGQGLFKCFEVKAYSAIRVIGVDELGHGLVIDMKNKSVALRINTQ